MAPWVFFRNDFFLAFLRVLGTADCFNFSRPIEQIQVNSKWSFGFFVLTIFLIMRLGHVTDCRYLWGKKKQPLKRLSVEFMRLY